MTLAEIKSMVTEYINDDSLDRWVDSVRTLYINTWYKKILNDADWLFLQATDSSITTVAGTISYAKPAGVQKILGIWLDEIKPANKLGELDQKRREVFDFTMPARPRYYNLFGNNIEILNKTDAAYNLVIRYIQRVPDLVSDMDEPVFDPDFHYLIALGAATSLKKTNGGSQINESDNLVQEYLAGLERMKERLLPGTNDRPLAVENTWDFYPQDSFNNT